MARSFSSDINKPRCYHTGGAAASVLSALLVLIVVGTIAAIIGYSYINRMVSQPRQPGDIIYSIEPGQSLGDWLSVLKQRSVIEQTQPLALWARLQGKANQIKAGQYRFVEGQSFESMLDQVIAGDVHREKIAFIEGLRSKDFVAQVKKTKGLRQTLGDATIEDIMASLGRAGVHPEGSFYPDTYFYDAGSTDVDLLQRAVERMDTVLEQQWAQRQPDLPLKSAQEALILASIIEKETSVADERPLIAGVFINRLRKGMKLQTDPTVIYGIGDDFDGNITRKHLRTDTPYNTYTRKGLPPSPIAAAGKEAIWAALNPAETDAIFFVSKGDGTHQFSKTLKQHNAAVKRYQLK